MDQVCFALPVLEDKTEDARAFFDGLETQRKSASYAASEQPVAILATRTPFSRSPRRCSRE